MAVIEALTGKRDDARDEFDRAEESDLPLHVRQCIRRDRDTRRELRAIRYLILLMFGFHVITTIPGAASWLKLWLAAQ